MHRSNAVVAILLLLQYHAVAQVDSLRNELKKSLPDTTRFNILSELVWQLRIGNEKQTLDYAREALKIANRLDDDRMRAQAHNDAAIVNLLAGKLPDAMQELTTSLALRRKLNDTLLIASSLSKIGMVYNEMGDYENALRIQLEVEGIYEARSEQKNLTYTLNNIATIYDKMKQADLQIAYANRALQLAREANDSFSIASALGNVAAGLLRIRDVDRSIAMHDTAYHLYLQIGDPLSASIALNNIGYLYRLKNQLHDGLHYYLLAYDIAKELGEINSLSQYAANIAGCYIDLNQLSTGLRYLNEAETLADSIHAKAILKQCYMTRSEYHHRKGELLLAYDWLKKYADINDSIFSEEKSRSMSEMQVRYDTEKKQRENDLLTQQNQLQQLRLSRQRIVISALLVASVAIALIFWLLYNRYKLRQRELLNAEMLKQQELRTKAVIEAENKERTRIAKDLHDGVGQLLSSAKLNLSALDRQLAEAGIPQRDLFLNTQDLVDEAVREVRNVSHSMMPNALIKLGLAAAVREFVQKISGSGQLKIHLEIIGLDNRLEEQTESILYRIIQELVNNIIKHAGATAVTIQLIRHDDEISLMVEDNGKGFDANQQRDGIGLRNIESRVAFLGGRADFDSAIGRGTTVSIQIPIKPAA